MTTSIIDESYHTVWFSTGSPHFNLSLMVLGSRASPVLQPNMGNACLPPHKGDDSLKTNHLTSELATAP